MLPEKVNRLEKNIANDIKGLKKTLVIDGWSSKKRKHLVAMIFLVKGKLYFTIVYDNSSVKKKVN